MPRIIYIIAGVGIALILIFLIFFGFDSGRNPSSTGKKAVVLADQAFSDVSVSATIDSAIKGDDVHRAIKITIDNQNRTLTVYQGYQGTVLKSQSLDNNPTAFKQFLTALQTSGFLLSKKTNIVSVDGQCPLGLRYIYASSGIEDIPNNLWATSCSAKVGTFAGNASLINRLFQNQITNYNDLVFGVKLY
jgi:hypothetical protein